ncbi:MAG TPA: SMC-Scp complex subunit ScpB [Acidobacteriaceae bacterium]|nr:SMC-Scp complex subunit ScpB [Acidobacteriaceae bacterium]
MSLKAKIEAVIYAADEPVTLAQLASIFAEEALASVTAVSLPFVLPEPPDGNMKVSVTEEDSTHRSAPPEPEGNSLPDNQATLPMEDVEAKRQSRLRDRQARLAIQQIIEGLITEYADGERGMEIREIAGGYRIATKAEYHDAVRSFVKSLKPQMKLSLQALETLAVVAYKQPVTAPEISEIRGVDTAGVLGSLMARKLITTAGRKQVIGRPILYKTTKEFLLRFGLKDVSELPSMEEFEKMAAEISEPEQEGSEEPQFAPDKGVEESASAAAVPEEEKSSSESMAGEEENGAIF